MTLRRSTAFLLALSGGGVGALCAGAHAVHASAALGPDRAAQAALVRRLGLTDLCLTTEARYTRNPSQADRFSPFQDHPRALEHFPSGTWIRVAR